MKTIAIVGTFDTKGKKLKFIKDLVEKQGLFTLCIHTGVFEPFVTPDISNADLAAAVGVDIEEMRARSTSSAIFLKLTVSSVLPVSIFWLLSAVSKLKLRLSKLL